MDKKLLLEINNKEDLSLNGIYKVVGFYKYTSFGGLYLTIDELKDIKDKENIFILLNALIHQKDFEDFKETALTLIKLGFNFIIQDIGALYFIYKNKLETTKIIYNGYTLICNDCDFISFRDMFDIDIVLSNELTKEELSSFKNKDHAVATVYGYTPIYQSYREVISLFKEFRKVNLDDKSPIYLKEDTREDMFPTIENEYGTVIFRSKPLDRLSYLNELKDYKYWYISSLFVDKEELNKILEELRK